MNTDILEQIASQPPPFHEGKLCTYRDWAADKYVSEVLHQPITAVVDLRDVIGHGQGYGELTWGGMLGKLSRLESRLKELQQNPTYYLSLEGKHDWSFIKVEGKLFIDQGKHRSVILRYLAHYNPSLFPNGPVVSGVKVIPREVDWELTDLVEGVKRGVARFEYLQFRDISAVAGEKRWQLINRRQEQSWIFTRQELPQLKGDLDRSTPLNRFLGKGNHRRFRVSKWGPH